MSTQTTRTCSRCSIAKPLDEFPRNASKALGRAYGCKTCRRAQARADPSVQRGYTERWRAKVTATVRALKEGTPCADCGRFGPYYAMDYDHVGDEKNFEIGMAVASMKYPLEAILAEIELCELVCAYCHRIRTHARGYGPK